MYRITFGIGRYEVDIADKECISLFGDFGEQGDQGNELCFSTADNPPVFLIVVTYVLVRVVVGSVYP